MKIEEIEEMMIGKRVAEILAGGFRLDLSRSFRVSPIVEPVGTETPEKVNTGPTFRAYVQSEDLRDTPEQNSRYVKGATLLDMLNKAANVVRYINGKPSIERELAKLEAEDAQHAASPIVETGPDARCGCGSRKPLILERTIKLEIPWQTGQPVLDRVFGLMGIEGLPDSGEIGTCPDCGKFYRFGS